MAPFLFDPDDDDELEDEEVGEDEFEGHDGDQGFFIGAELMAEVDADIQEPIESIQEHDHGAGPNQDSDQGIQDTVNLLQMEDAFEAAQGLGDAAAAADLILSPTNSTDSGNIANEDMDMEEEEEEATSTTSEGDVELMSTTSEEDLEGQDITDAHLRVPTIARWRLNLTGLSQRYNLYFAAYKDKIHISRPRSCSTHNLPSIPDLVLRPGPSDAAQSIGGQLDAMFPHQVNHLIIGNFGEEEILLLAYDDGDVIGYYTRAIERWVGRFERYTRSKPVVADLDTFFHENAKISAWGLAVHSKSRIIAVGTNLHEIVVFMPALAGHPFESKEGRDTRHHYYTVTMDASGVRIPESHGIKEFLNREDDFEYENCVRRRDANWMITFETKPLGDNIPNVTFSDDKDGNADKVVGIDVKGNIWLMDLWVFGSPFKMIPPLHCGPPGARPGDAGRPRGWGALVIHSNSFLPTDGYEDSLGISKNKTSHVSHSKIGSWVDISKSVESIPHNSVEHPWARPRHGDPHMEHHGSIDTEWWFQAYAADTVHAQQRHYWQVVSPLSSLGILPQGMPVSTQSSPLLADGASIMRLYEADIELRSHEEHGFGVMLQNATRQIHPRPPGLPALRWAHERLSNNHYIPELALVLAGSMCGRVALITLTQTERDDVPFKRGFKVEAILPLKHDEDKRLRPICPLFGVAVGPLPVDDTPELISPKRPRRFRVMLQYYDQRILSYEITRGAWSDALTVI
ncbi:hypothetical protein BKA67DRAFT_34846 [Truncatella angustata]|uniref:Uncharacterized protein n=1 Tax=Truncatella angustata TaxID=152316 RepID=A0A9P8UVG5_9PEZI|nr:uncharacterized protein BKA67DRAFT_34846 [Truncatella angustata]KAH6659979.1 hypothetical protein BKA67DRAFT_34846 [Truncatella angustata]